MMKRHRAVPAALLLALALWVVPGLALPGAAQAQQAETPEGSFVYEIAPGQDVIPLSGNRYEYVVPRLYYEGVTSGAGPEARASLDLVLRYKGIDTTRDYILYDEVSGNPITSFSIQDPDKARVANGIILFAKPTDQVRLKIPLDHQTARAGRITLSLRGSNRQENYDLEKKCGYAILKPQVELKTPFAKYRSSVSAQGDRYSLALTVEDFNLSYVLSTLDKREEGQDVSRRGASFDLPFSADKGGVREAGFCLWPRFAQAYDPALLAKDIACETFVSAVNREQDLAEVARNAAAIAAKLPPPSKDSIRLTPVDKPADKPAGKPGTDKAESGQSGPSQSANAPKAPEKGGDKPQARKEAEKPAPDGGVKLRIRSDSDPGDQVRVNGESLGATPVVHSFAKGTRHTIELRYSRDSGGGQKTYQLDVAEGKFTVRYQNTAETEALAPGETWELWLQVKKDRTKDFRLVKIKQ
jgi:hypothetical protein